MHCLQFRSPLVLMLFASSTVAAVVRNATTSVGCYSSAGVLTISDTDIYQSSGHCHKQCIPDSGQNSQAVMGMTRGGDCWCGNALPPEADRVDDGECDKTCNGFDKEICGGQNTFSIYLTGLDDNVGSTGVSDNSHDTESGPSVVSSTRADAASPSTLRTAPTTIIQQASTIIRAGTTIVVTTAAGQVLATGEPADNPSSDGEADSGPNKIGIAVGVVVGVVALAALIGAAVYFIRRRKRMAVEEDYRRKQSMGGFVNNDKSHSKSASISDQRLDPSILHHRRQSDGSIADEMDFSRRILQVRNPDGV